MSLPVGNNTVPQQPPLQQQFAPDFSRNTDGYSFCRKTESLPLFKIYVNMEKCTANFVCSGMCGQMTDLLYRLVTDGINKMQEPKTKATKKNLNDRFCF